MCCDEELASLLLIPWSLMALHMKGQMIGSGEAAVTMGTFERLAARVFSIMTGQFIGSREAPFASIPGAFVWLLPCVGPQVSLQVRRFSVYFFAAIILTLVYPPAQFRGFEDRCLQ